MLNAGDSEAHVAVHHFHHFFADRDPMRPYRIMVPARAPLPVPRDRAFSSVFESGVPIVVQHTHTHGSVRAAPTRSYCQQPPTANPKACERSARFQTILFYSA
jgi:hypothetical protein